MQSNRIISAVAILAFVLSTSFAVAADSPVVGQWNFTSKFEAMNTEATMTITKDAQGKYAGTWSAQWGESTLSDITVDTNKVKFIQTSSFGGQDMKTNYEGTLEGAKFKGAAKGPWGEFTFEGTREDTKDQKDALTGQWQMNITIPAREIVDKMTITQNADGNLVGKWEGARGESTISNLKFADGKLTFTRTSKMGSMEVTLSYEGTLNGDTIKGAFSSEFGEREVTAVRVSAKTETPKPEPNKPPAK